MQSINITEIISKIHKIVENHKLAPGCYSRFIEDDFESPYGCADAANILYTIGKFPKDRAERDASVATLRQMQDPQTGMFSEKPSDPNTYVHDPIHTTAHCIAALELFDAAPLYRATELEQYLEPDKFNEFMEAINWRGNPWSQSHKPAGLYVALNLGGTDCREFNKMYFNWMWENADPDTGLWRKGCQDGTVRLWDHMAGSFHYLFNHEYAHMPLRYPDKLIDSCIKMYKEDFRKGFYDGISFIQIDWVYCLTRAMQQTPHRFNEAMECLEEFAEKYFENWETRDYTEHHINNLHGLFGAVCCMAELQRALRGKIYSETPLKLVLDRRPFI